MSKLLPYQRNASITYAKRWALSRNPIYYSFDRIGGDCTNFISQCLHAGAMKMNFTPTFGWYYNSLSDRSPSWTSAQYLNQFLLSNTREGPHGMAIPKEQLLPGDIIQLENNTGNLYHSLIVLSTESKIFVAAHDDDSLYRPLDTYRYAKAHFIRILGGL